MVDVVIMVAVFALSFLVGHLLISRVPPMLHTPLMSMTNAISAVIIIGALLLFSQEGRALGKVLGGVAIFAASFNLVGGFVITDRMLGLFRTRDVPE